VDQHIGVFENDFHAFGVGDEVGGQVAAVELESFNDFEVGFEAFPFFDGDHTILADLFHGIGKNPPDLFVAVGGNGADLSDRFAGAAFLSHPAEVGDDVRYGAFHPAFHVERTHTGNDSLETFVVDGFSHDSCGGGTVTSHVAGLAGHFPHHASTHVFELVREFDFTGNSDTVLGDGG